MTMFHRNALLVAPASHRAQRGAVLIVSLIVLVVMLISAAALMRSFDTSLKSAGNLAFKRDLAQQSEQAAEVILARFRDGSFLSVPLNRQANRPNLNYSATALASNAQGIPNILLNDAAFDGTFTAAPITTAEGVTLRYIVDRLCGNAALPETQDNCTVSGASLAPGGSSSNWQRAERALPGATAGTGAGAVAPPVVYRISIRATGPRNTQSFFQSTFSR